MRETPSLRDSSVRKTAAQFCITFCISLRTGATGSVPLPCSRPLRRAMDSSPDRGGAVRRVRAVSRGGAQSANSRRTVGRMQSVGLTLSPGWVGPGHPQRGGLRERG
eukprot:1187209-Prorocentrum_minimum.AAC.5